MPTRSATESQLGTDIHSPPDERAHLEPTTSQAPEFPLLDELRGAFYRVGQALASSLNLDESLTLIAEAALGIMRGRAATVQLVEPDGGRLAPKAASGPARQDLVALQGQAGALLTERILLSRQAIQVSDLWQDFRLDGVGAASSLRGYVAVPLVLRGEVTGVLAIARAEPGAFSVAEVELLSSFASQAAVAIENARLFGALQGKLREVSGLYEVSLALGALPQVENTHGQLVERIALLLGVERCAILLHDEASDELIGQPRAYGLTPEQVQRLRLRLDGISASARVWRTGKPYLTNDAQRDPHNVQQFAREFGDSSLLIVPMIVQGKPIGLLRASNKLSGRFSDDDTRLLTIFATQAAVVLRNAMLYREVLQERQRLQAIFDNASDGIAIIGPDQRILAFNPAMEALTGWKADEAVTSSCHHIYKNHDDKGISLCHSACPMVTLYNRSGGAPYVETIMTTRDGTQRDVAISYSPIAPLGSDDPAAGQVVAIVRDISRSKEIERAKSQFVSTVSHELRTPLASIKASVGVLLASMPEETPEAIVRLLRNIDRSTQRLESMVIDLLDLARLQSGRVRLSLRRVDLAEVAGEAIATIRPLCDAKWQTVTLVAPKRPPLVQGDRQRLGQVLLNLLSNANKYTPDGGEITVRLNRRGPDAVLAVEDDGPGIPPEEQERIFERFYRPENGSTQTNVGTGLGLPIAKALVELHGGRIWLRSETGKGSSFYVALPREGIPPSSQRHVI